MQGCACCPGYPHTTAYTKWVGMQYYVGQWTCLTQHVGGVACAACIPRSNSLFMSYLVNPDSTLQVY
jgi:hypothetical protein